MNEADNNNLDINNLVKILYLDKSIIFASIVFFFLTSSVYTYFIPNLYKSSVLVIGIDENQNNIADLASNYSSLANLAGINLNIESDKITTAIGILNSRKFVNDFVENKNIVIPLMAANDWNLKTNELKIDSSLYDVKNKKWVRDVTYPLSVKPSKQEIYRHWIKNVFSIEQNDKNNFIKLNITYFSPFLAQEWATWLIEDINNHMRNIDLNEAQNSINYLNKALLETESKELESLIYNLIETNIKKIMLTKSREDYVFKVIDPAIAPEMKSSPMRFLIIVMSSVFGFFVGVFVVLTKNYITRN